MNGDLGLVAQLVFWGALLLGLAVGGAVGAWKGLNVGGATAGLIIGVIGLAASTFVLYTYWRFWQEPNAAEATIVSADKPKDGASAALTLRFTTRDGRTIETDHAGPMPQTPSRTIDAGDTIGVLYGADASTVTLHSVRGSLIGGVVFGMFSMFALLVGLFFIAQLADERSGARARSNARTVAAPAPTRPLVTRVLTVSSNVTSLAAFAWMMFAPGDKLQTFAVSLRVVAVAGIGYATAAFLTPGGPWTTVMIPLIVGITFAMFSALIRIVS
jgi:hypothetical protein